MRQQISMQPRNDGKPGSRPRRTSVAPPRPGLPERFVRLSSQIDMLRTTLPREHRRRPASRCGNPGKRGAIRINVQPDDLPVTTCKRAAYEAIRDMIVEMEIPPGTRLVESDLATRLRVSKTPIREAIALLETDSLVSIVPYRGATVRWLSRLEVEEQRFLIDAVELPAFPLVVERISRQTMAELGVGLPAVPGAGDPARSVKSFRSRRCDRCSRSATRRAGRPRRWSARHRGS
jgi:Bacterial regulatory proteins, gntR family